MPSTTPYRPPRKQGPAFRFIVVVVVPLLKLLMKRDWRGGENIPATGGVVIAANHISHVDALAFGHFVYGNGRMPRFLAKSGVFKNAFVGGVLRAAKQIPVYRDTADAANALRDAIAAVRAEEAVAVYPEGTITRDPGLWPMAAKTGAARIALTTGCPVIPVAQWGPQEILAYHEKRPHLLPRKRMIMLAGPPVDLEDLRTLPQNAQTLKEATDRIMDAITDLLAKVRGEAPPVARFVPDSGAGNLYGNHDDENDDVNDENDENGSATEGDRTPDGDGETGKQVDTA
ncbi:MAG: 1-acyl-sn-glycerol-3-phosphate acyltransferase [Catenulispora sp. 13_1_20CM_3_70_7]|nr:1-acyl-sn-glycerol-3-phosphate acyltransferase [Catenulisporales bacterium]OLE24884.1 MAG: 1-acyl-sn-glycerol-3-phosphate acyltransferase [Catenulispora sp. 13_1_20CM_3_70_7]